MSAPPATGVPLLLNLADAVSTPHVLAAAANDPHPPTCARRSRSSGTTGGTNLSSLSSSVWLDAREDKGGTHALSQAAPRRAGALS
jgi:hypothetical protein